MDRYEVEAVVIGAGVVGLAVARRLALAGLETIVVEKNAAIGMETSARSSEVIHAGLYYAPGSIKARVAVTGRDRLYAYCAAHGVPHRRCGKFVLAIGEGQLPALAALSRTAAANGVDDLVWLSPADAAALEPEVACAGAILSPSTGIIDSHALMLAYRGDLEDHDGQIALHAPVERVMPGPDGLVVTTGGDAPAEIAARIVVNAAGHGAPRIAAATEGLTAAGRPRQWYAKGSYFSLVGRQPFSRLVYPLPGTASLGVHATLDLDGRCRFGPDVEWVESDDDLAVSPARAESFYAAIRSYWPALPDGALQPDYAGIRPKLHGPDMPMPDFRIDGPEAHGIAGLVNLFGIESPGLTTSLALADVVVERLGLPPLGVRAD